MPRPRSRLRPTKSSERHARILPQQQLGSVEGPEHASPTSLPASILDQAEHFPARLACITPKSSDARGTHVESRDFSGRRRRRAAGGGHTAVRAAACRVVCFLLLLTSSVFLRLLLASSYFVSVFLRLLLASPRLLSPLLSHANSNRDATEATRFQMRPPYRPQPRRSLRLPGVPRPAVSLPVNCQHPRPQVRLQPVGST